MGSISEINSTAVLLCSCFAFLSLGRSVGLGERTAFGRTFVGTVLVYLVQLWWDRNSLILEDTVLGVCNGLR
jgi:hypothetical protein